MLIKKVIPNISNFRNIVIKKTPKKVVTEVLPFVATPIILFNSGPRNANISASKNDALKEIKKLLDNKQITQLEYNSRKKEITEYYKAAKKTDAKVVSSQEVKKNAPNFKGEDENSEIVDSEGASEELSFLSKMKNWFKEKFHIGTTSEEVSLDVPSKNPFDDLAFEKLDLPPELVPYSQGIIENVDPDLVTDAFAEGVFDDVSDDNEFLTSLKNIVESCREYFQDVIKEELL